MLPKAWTNELPYLTTDTKQTITADKIIDAHLYSNETGYKLTPENTGLKIDNLSKSCCTLGSKIKFYINSSDAYQRADNLELTPTDYFILRYNGNISEYDFKVKTDVIGSVHWTLTDISGTVISSGFVGNDITTIECIPGESGDYRLSFDYTVNIYEWSSNSGESFRYITLAERGTKMYHHHIKVCNNEAENTQLWMDVLSTHPESLENQPWEYLKEYKTVGMATIYALDDFGDVVAAYTLCGWEPNHDFIKVFDYRGETYTFNIDSLIQIDIVTM